MTDQQRSIQAEIEVPGTPEEVWAAIATGPGISSWYVPHTVEERPGGSMLASFGPGMEAPGRVAAWEPPDRVVFDGGEGAAGLAFEWMIEARDGGTCIVRLVNSGFGSGTDWDDQYDAMRDGWQLFLCNLRLHLEHFRGRQATALLPMAVWNAAQPQSWRELCRRLGIDSRLGVGDRVDIELPEGLGLAGSVAARGDHSVSLLLAAPADGTAFIAAERAGEQTSVSIWSYLYGDDRETLAARDATRWSNWLEANAPSTPSA